MTELRSRRDRNKKKRKFRWGRLIALFLTIIIVGSIAYFSINVYNNAKLASSKIFQKLDLSKGKNYRGNKPVEITKDPFTILLTGLDTQGGGLGRSDVLLLLTVNPQTKKIYEVSIPRDTRTYIPTAGKTTKINSAYSYGGIESTVGALNELLDVPIDYYITTNFQGFQDIVDTFGGVDVDVPFTFRAQLTGSLRWMTYTQGHMYLNGNQALAYVRMRKSDPHGDFGRNERQKQVIKAVVDKGTSFSSITKINAILNNLGDNVKTNIPPSKLLSFVELYSKLKDSKIINLKVSGQDEYINNIYYFHASTASLDEVNNTLRSALDLNSTADASQTNQTDTTNTTDTANN